MAESLICYLQSIDVCSPGLAGWQQACSVFNNQRPFSPENQTMPKADILSPREKRRASDTVNLSLHLAHNAQQTSEIAPQLLRSVFASSDGDNDIFDYLCCALAEPEPAISPTIFHQSLHNSVAGYWGIVTKSNEPSLSLSAENQTFASALLTAATELASTNKPVLLVAYNLTSPGAMTKCNPITTWFGASMVLNPTATKQTISKLSISLCPKQPPSALNQPALQDLYKGNPIARCLPLLEAIATAKPKTLLLDYLHPFSLNISLEPVAHGN